MYNILYDACGRAVYTEPIANRVFVNHDDGRVRRISGEPNSRIAIEACACVNITTRHISQDRDGGR
eukprot:2183076-Pyramimonas_sp.AAC.2